MARSRDWLDRFRPAGSPGSATRPGVPSDISESERQIAAIFELLQPVESECARIRAEAEREASRRRDAASESAAEMLASANARLPAVRAEAFARIAGRASTDSDLAAAESAAARLESVGRTRMPSVVAAVRGEFLGRLRTLTDIDFPAPARDLSDAVR